MLLGEVEQACKRQTYFVSLICPLRLVLAELMQDFAGVWQGLRFNLELKQEQVADYVRFMSSGSRA